MLQELLKYSVDCEHYLLFEEEKKTASLHRNILTQVFSTFKAVNNERIRGTPATGNIR